MNYPTSTTQSSVCSEETMERQSTNVANVENQQRYANVITAQSRLQWVDAMRGFSMLIVVFGHVLVWSKVNSGDSALVRVLMTFRMPLFFFVSGFFSYRLITWWNWTRVGDIVKRKIQAQVIGTLVFFCVYHYVMGQFITFTNGFGAYWFTVVLFQMYMVYLLLSLVSRKLRCEITLPIMIVTSALMCISLFVYKPDFGIANMLSWLNLAQYIQFFTLGLLCHKFREKFQKIISSSGWITVFIISWIGGLLFMCSDWAEGHLGMVSSFNRNVFVRYSGLLCIITLFSHCATALSSSDTWACLLRFIGRRTLDIYFIHFFFLPHVDGISDWLTYGDRVIFQILYASVVTFAITAMCLLVSHILRSSPFLASWLFGVKVKQ